MCMHTYNTNTPIYTGSHLYNTMNRQSNLSHVGLQNTCPQPK